MELSDNFHALVTSPTYPCIHLVGGWWALELPWTLYRRKNSFFPCRESNLRFFGCQACSLFRRKNNVVSISLCPFVDNIRSLVYERTSNDVAGYEFFLNLSKREVLIKQTWLYLIFIYYAWSCDFDNIRGRSCPQIRSYLYFQIFSYENFSSVAEELSNSAAITVCRLEEINWVILHLNVWTSGRKKSTSSRAHLSRYYVYRVG